MNTETQYENQPGLHIVKKPPVMKISLITACIVAGVALFGMGYEKTRANSLQIDCTTLANQMHNHDSTNGVVINAQALFIDQQKSTIAADSNRIQTDRQLAGLVVDKLKDITPILEQIKK